MFAAFLTLALSLGMYEIFSGEDSSSHDSDNPTADPDVTQGGNTSAGTPGNDIIAGGDSADDLFGQFGNDLIDGGNGTDMIEGDAGNDTLEGGAGDDILGGGTGNDQVTGGHGADVLFGNAGDDVIAGGTHNDILVGGNGSDTLLGGDGNDTLTGGFMTDIDNTNGDNGADVSADFFSTLKELVETDPDFFTGRTEAEILEHPMFDGVDTDLTVMRETGADSLSGGAGNDVLQLGAGDIGNGGLGADTFILSTNQSGNEVIVEDYNPDEDHISFTYNAVDGPPTIAVTDDGPHAVVSIDGVDMVRVYGAAGQLDASQVLLEQFS
ncbi:calcium-binding protein [Cochlodiniinecator piscidefendens]|uniref:calcium-binding protein n=1 Tax=Cochlodiniinecator piscidefendens TaxID=2715756 RepID=UPI00140C84E2|nr:calcium-binding protein [Cochlodiniinecator piscidefendens]